MVELKMQIEASKNFHGPEHGAYPYHCAPPDRWDPQTPPSEDATVPILPPASWASRLFLHIHGYTKCHDRLQPLWNWYAMIPMHSVVVKVYLNTQLPTWHACDTPTR